MSNDSTRESVVPRLLVKPMVLCRHICGIKYLLVVPCPRLAGHSPQCGVQKPTECTSAPEPSSVAAVPWIYDLSWTESADKGGIPDVYEKQWLWRVLGGS